MTIDRSKLWTGSLNQKALDPQPRVTVGLYDTTLRDGEQSVGVVLSPRTSSRSRAPSTRRGSTVSRPGSLASRPTMARGRLVSGAGLTAEVWGFSRAVQADVEALVESACPPR